MTVSIRQVWRDIEASILYDWHGFEIHPNLYFAYNVYVDGVNRGTYTTDRLMEYGKTTVFKFPIDAHYAPVDWVKPGARITLACFGVDPKTGEWRYPPLPRDADWSNEIVYQQLVVPAEAIGSIAGAAIGGVAGYVLKPVGAVVSALIGAGLGGSLGYGVGYLATRPKAIVMTLR